MIMYAVQNSNRIMNTASKNIALPFEKVSTSFECNRELNNVLILDNFNFSPLYSSKSSTFNEVVFLNVTCHSSDGKLTFSLPHLFPNCNIKIKKHSLRMQFLSKCFLRYCKNTSDHERNRTASN